MIGIKVLTNKEVNMKVIKIVLHSLFIPIVLLPLFFPNLADHFNLVNMDLYFALAMLMFLFIEIKLKIFNSFTINCYIMILIILQVISAVLSGVFKGSSITEGYTKYFSFILFIVISLVIINRYFFINLSKEILLLRFKVFVQQRIGDKNSRITRSLETISIWVDANKRIRRNDYIHVVKILENVIEDFFHQEINFVPGSDENSTEKFVSLLRLMYERNNSVEFLSVFLRVIKKIILLQDRLGNTKNIDIYTNLLTEQVLQNEILVNLNEKRNVVFVLDNLFSLVTNKQDNYLVDKIFNDTYKTYIQFDFSFTSIEYIFLVQNLVDILNKNEANKIKWSRYIFKILDDKSETEKLVLFREAMIRRILENESDPKKKLGILIDITNIHEINQNGNNGTLLFIARYLADYVSTIEDKEMKFLYIRFQIETIEKLPIGFRSLLNYKNIFEFLSLLSTSEESRCLDNYEDTLRLIARKKNTFEFFVFGLYDGINEDNTRTSIKIFKGLISEILDESDVIYHSLILATLEKIVDNIIKAVSINTSLSKHVDYDIVDLIEQLDKSLGVGFKNKLVDFLMKYIDNKVVGNLVFKYIFDVAVKEIESSNPTTVKICSNRFGWYLFNKIKDNTAFPGSIEILKDLKDIFTIFELAVRYLDESSIIFIGTLFVVNGVFIEIKLSEKLVIQSSEFYKSFYERVDSLDSESKEFLLKSYNIRRYIVDSFFKGIDEEIINAAKRSFYRKSFDKTSLKIAS